MKTKRLEDFLEISNEELEFVKGVRKHIDAILERDFDVYGIDASIEFLDVRIYVYPQTFIFRLLKDTIQILKKSDTEDASVLEMEIKNKEVYNNIIDKVNEKRQYLSVNLLELTRLED